MFLCVLSAGSAPAAYRVSAGPDWVPIDYRKGIEPGSALDFSVFGLADAPAGKHGWLETRGEHFVFPDSPDVPRRFYGPNLVFDACCPVGDDAEMLADRLVRMGYNSVRLHGWDCSLPMGDEGWGRKWDSHTWAPEKIDRMDRLCAALFARGIYVTTDLFVSREVTWGDVGEDNRMGHTPDEPLSNHIYKALVLVDEVAYADWLAEASKFLRHVNPYTGRAYADEPGMPFLCLVNECNLASQWKNVRDMPAFRAAWRAWRGPDEPPPDNSKSDIFAEFEEHLEARFFERAKKYLREALGVKALLTNQNIGQNRPPLQRLRERLYDYNDGHTYEAHPRSVAGAEATGMEAIVRFDENDPTAIDWMGGVARANAAIVGKPTTVSEWDYCYPARSRSCAGLIMGSLMAQQDFAAGWRYGWICSRAKRCDELKDACTFPARPFSALTDPVALGTDKMATLLFLRGDAPAFSAPGVCLRLTKAAFKRADGLSPRSDKAFPFGGVWQTRFAQSTDAPTPPGWREIRYEDGEALRARGEDTPYHIDADPDAVFRRDPVRRLITVVTPRTCGGFAFPESGRVESGPLAFTLSGSRATVCATSVDPDMRPLATARRILVMHLTDLQSEGSEFSDETFQTTLKKGAAPLVADGTAKISLRLSTNGKCHNCSQIFNVTNSVANMQVLPVASSQFPIGKCNLDLDNGNIGNNPYKVFALATDGRRLGEVPCEWNVATTPPSSRDGDGAVATSGTLSFTASVRGSDGKARLYYEITRP